MSEETTKVELTKEELAKAWKDYYEWLDSIYQIKNFELTGKNGQKLCFFHGFNQGKENSKKLAYLLRDSEYGKVFEEQKKKDLLGESRNGESLEDRFKTMAFINIDTENKVFNFGVDWDYKGRGYGNAIYYNYMQILQMLGIEDGEKYELRCYGNPNHDYFKRIATKELVKKAKGEPDRENAISVLEEFANHPNKMLFKEFNDIIEYAIASGLEMQQITDAINANGFNILYNTVNSIPRFNDADLQKFNSFGIKGIKPTSLHEHFIRNRNFAFMQFVKDADIEDTTLEFRRILEYLKKDKIKRQEENRYISSNLEKYGELEHIILDWDYSGLLFGNVSSDIQQLVKRQAIEKFDEFDEEHEKSWQHSDIDNNTLNTLRMLEESGLMNKDSYISLYQRALNRNYNLNEFDKIAREFIGYEERTKALEEIEQNSYYPCPKGKWQRESSYRTTSHSILRIGVPKKISKKGNVRDAIKQEILNEGTAKKTKIKTTMTGTTKNGRKLEVDNLKDWLFGVPGTYGNMKMIGDTAIAFPPQTPSFAVDLVRKAISDLEYPDFSDR